MIVVLKRDGKQVDFNREKIETAINKAFLEVDGVTNDEVAISIADEIKDIGTHSPSLNVEEIQDLVEQCLIEHECIDVARAYIKYRYLHELQRKEYTDLMELITEKIRATNVQNQNANVDEQSFGGRVGETSDAILKKYALEYCVSPKTRENHLKNRIYIHDLSAYAVGSHNCLTVPFDELLAKGFNTRQTDVRPANSINTAFQLVAVIFQLQSLMQFGK